MGRAAKCRKVLSLRTVGNVLKTRWPKGQRGRDVKRFAA